MAEGEEDEAKTWDELDFLVKAAGVPIEQSLGLGISDSSDDEDYPSPKTFKENLKVTVHGVELEVPISAMMENFEVYGTWDLKEELFVPPPMMDLQPYLEPCELSTEARERATKWISDYLEKAQAERNLCEGQDTSIRAELSESSTPELPAEALKPRKLEKSLPTEARKPRRLAKRQRESDSESSPSTPDLFERVSGAAGEVMSERRRVSTITIPSSGSSSGMDLDDSVIDLTQQP